MGEQGGAQLLRAGYRDMALSLVKRLAALPEEGMRTVSLGRELSNMGALRAVWTLEWLIRAVLVKQPPAVEVYEGIVEPAPVTEILGGARVEAMVRAGFEEGCVAAGAWLAGRPTASGEAQEVHDGGLVHFQLRELTLGDRRALARRARGDDIKRLLVDSDPGVITNLLNNPRTTEETVLALCSRRPTVSSALEAVMGAPRWFRRYRIKRALLHNPHLALRCAVNLLPFLTRSDLAAVRADGTLVPPLRRGAQRLLDLFPAPGHPDEDSSA